MQSLFPKEDYMLKKSLTLGLITIIVLSIGCAAQRKTVMPEPRPLGRDIPSVHATLNDKNKPLSHEVIEQKEGLSLRQALVLALMKNPALEAFSHDVRAAEARTLQADLPPNPEMELELESFDRDREGYDSSEPSVMLGQVIELGRKRLWRVRVAEARSELAGWDYETKRMDVFTKTAHRFTAVIAAQQRLKLAQSSMKLANQTNQTVNERVKAGKEPPVQIMKADAEMAMAKLDTAKAENTLMLARFTLAAMWGATQPIFMKADGDLASILKTLPSKEVLHEQLSSNPELASRKVAVKLQQATLDSEKAARIPNLTVAAGIKRFEEDETHALIFGFGIPLPLFDRNQGNITAAKHELAKAKAEARSTDIGLSTRLTEANARLTSAQQRAQVLRSKVVPAMENIFNAAHKGYKEGKFDFLDVLDAQRTLFSARAEMIDALSDYHTALTDIERLTGMSIEELLQRKDPDYENYDK